MNTYTFSQVFVVVNGNVLTGLNSITVTRQSPSFEIIKGIRGHHSRRKTDDTSAVVQIAMLQTSFSNEVLSSFLVDDINKGTGRLSIFINDGMGRTLFSSNTGFIEGFPEVGFQEEIGDRVWVIQCLESELYVGGNTQPYPAAKSQVEGESSLLEKAGQVAGIVSKVGSIASVVKKIF